MHNPITVTAILVDDEQLALDNLSKLLELYCTAINVIERASNIEHAINLINHLKPDVVFLDINIHGKSGLDIVPLFTCSPFIVFVTAYEKYLLQALRLSAIDYLLKPIDINELIATELKLLELKKIKTSFGELSYPILNQLKQIKGNKIINKITLPNMNGYETFDLNKITYIKGSDNYSIFNITGFPEKVVAKTLREYEDILADTGFMRTHKSYLVNLSYVQSLSKKESLELLLQDGTRIPVSRRKSTEVLDWFRQNSHGNKKGD